MHPLYRKFIFVMLLVITPWSAAEIMSDEKQIETLLENFLAGVDRPEVHDSFWAEDLIYTSSKGIRTDKKSILAGFNQSSVAEDSSPSVTYRADDVTIRVYEQTAVLAFTLVALYEGDSNNHYYLNTGTLVKRNDRWAVVAWQATIKSDDK